MASPRQRSAATPLAVVFTALLVYASLYPFDNWRWAPGQSLGWLLSLPTSSRHVPFDVVANLLGYVPLGLLAAHALRRGGRGPGWAWALAFAAASLLSFACEVLQHLIPGRVPSLEDWLLNSAGAALGAALGLLPTRTGIGRRWESWRRRWFVGDAPFALALMLLWPLALLFPTPVPLGLGQVAEHLREALATALAGVPWAAEAQRLLAAAPPPRALRPLTEVLLVAAGLLGPVLLAYAVVAPGWRRLTVALGTLLAACGALALSTVLNFGPVHALAWVTTGTVQGLALGVVAALATLPLGQRAAAAMGLVVLTLLVAGLAQAPDNPYFEQSLQRWEQGRFVRFHGLSQWLGWVWPYAAIGWLMARVARSPRRRTPPVASADAA